MPTPQRQNSLLIAEASVAATSQEESTTTQKPLKNLWLTNTISTLGVVKELVPTPLGKGIVVAVIGILCLVKTAVRNQVDFLDLAAQCKVIGVVLQRATVDTPEERLSMGVYNALGGLSDSVMAIKDGIEKRAAMGVLNKVIYVTVDQETIAEWRRDLDRALALFNTEVNVGTNLKVGELVQEMHTMATRRATLIYEANRVVTPPDEVPAPPTVFVGRDALVQETIASLLNNQSVALIGSGGIGKSSIARAVLNNETIVSKFNDRRYFVRFDDMDVSQITFSTFLQRVSRALGLRNTYEAISRALAQREPVVLVLDNAERFLDAAVDAGRIAEAIDSFGARENVSILLTTRTTVLPPNVRWVRVKVPVLDEKAACKAFRMFYQFAIEPSVLGALLTEVDFHPLSINLLAQAAAQNEWTPEELVKAWGHQRMILLEAGDGKFQNIAVTIETSLNSPSITRLGDTIRDLAQIIAFLPQGLSKSRLADIFPDLKNVVPCAEALCKHSLAYIKGDYITFLAPVRLYISSKYNGSQENIPYLSVVQYYYRTHIDIPAIVVQDDANIEQVAAWALRHTGPDRMLDVLALVSAYVGTLEQYRPRRIKLLPHVLALGKKRCALSLGCLKKRDTAFVLSKGRCLSIISLLLYRAGNHTDATMASTEARALYMRCGPEGRLCIACDHFFLTSFHLDRGNLIEAEGAVRAAMKQRSSSLVRRILRDQHRGQWKKLKLHADYTLWSIELQRGAPVTAEVTANVIPSIKKSDSPGIVALVLSYAGYAELHRDCFDEAKAYFEEALDVAPKFGDVYPWLMSLLGLVDVAVRRNDKEEGGACRARVIGVLGLPDADSENNRASKNQAMSILALYCALEGDITQARELIRPISSNSLEWTVRDVQCAYSAACIELYDGDLEKASNLFKEVVEDATAIEELQFRARAQRALGEIAFLEKDIVVARSRFDSTRALCEVMGIHTGCLYRDHLCYMLRGDFNAWSLYLNNCLPAVGGIV